MSTTLPTGLVLPEDGGSSQIWDNMLNADLTLIDKLVRQVVALANAQTPVGTTIMIPEDSPLPVGWAEADPKLWDAVLIGSGDTISEGDSGGTKEWNENTNTGTAGDHQHGFAGDHQHAAAGAHTHGSYSGSSSAVSLTRAHLPNEPLTIQNSTLLVSVNTPANFSLNTYNATYGLKSGLGFSTENMGSGHGHAHSIAHTHASDGNHQHASAGAHEHAAAGDHTHTTTTEKWGCGGRWIVKSRNLTLADLQSMEPVN